jgi:serine/threonine-protein kinase
MPNAVHILGAVLIAASTGVVGCSSNNSGTASSPSAPPTGTATSAPPAPNSKEALEARARELDTLASQGKAAEAYTYYSQRCKNIIGDLDSYKLFLDQWRKDRNFQPGPITVRINGSSAQVVTVDNDPNAPASSMDPRTWTFIDGTWQFDNC